MRDLVVLIVEEPPFTELEGEVTVIRHGSLAAAQGMLLEGGFDCVLLDLTLPDSAGLESVRGVATRAPQAPLVVLSSVESEAIAMRAVQEGAQDYLPKGRADGPQLERVIRRAIERKRAELELALRATHDELTGLPNRTLFLDRLALALGRLERRSRSAAVMFVDLDGFRAVNDSLGSAAGDAVVMTAAQRLRALMRPGDTVARFGGDEFMLVCDDVASPEDAIAVAERLRAALMDPFAVDGNLIGLGASIGIVLATDRSRPAEALLRDADRGMREAKARGGGIELYSPRPLQVAGNELPAA